MHKFIAILSAAIIIVAGAQSASAYSYAEKEDVMVTIFKDGAIAAKEGKWDIVTAKSKEGIALQEGHIFEADALLPIFEKAIASKDVSKTAGTFANLVYIAIREKLGQCQKGGFKDFKGDKGRVSMARKSYIDILDGNVRRFDTNKSKAILTQFDIALGSIGNPGLFGIGAKPAEPATFEKAIKSIEEMITSSFPKFIGGATL